MIPAFILAIETEEEQNLAAKIFEEQFPRMKSIAYSILNNEQDMEDAAMNAMQHICDNISLFMDYDSTNSIYLISTYTRNAAIDIYRRNKNDSENLQSIYEDTDTTDHTNILENIAVSQENTKIFANAIASLDDMYRDPIILQYVYELKHEEIAKILHIEPNTVAGRVFRARKKLARILVEKELTYVGTKGF